MHLSLSGCSSVGTSAALGTQRIVGSRPTTQTLKIRKKYILNNSDCFRQSSISAHTRAEQGSDLKSLGS